SLCGMRLRLEHHWSNCRARRSRQNDDWLAARDFKQMLRVGEFRQQRFLAIVAVGAKRQALKSHIQIEFSYWFRRLLETICQPQNTGKKNRGVLHGCRQRAE